LAKERDYWMPLAELAVAATLAELAVAAVAAVTHRESFQKFLLLWPFCFGLTSR
jgi:hypothetical protein